MIGLLQRVGEAWVEVDATRTASIGAGLLVLVGVERGDEGAQASRLAERLLGYRVFGDEEGRMNLDVRTRGGGVLLVPQFTLAADTARGTRPGFSSAAAPGTGETLFNKLVENVRTGHTPVATGVFGADMRIGLINEGPVTFRLRVPPAV